VGCWRSRRYRIHRRQLQPPADYTAGAGILPAAASAACCRERIVPQPACGAAELRCAAPRNQRADVNQYQYAASDVNLDGSAADVNQYQYASADANQYGYGDEYQHAVDYEYADDYADSVKYGNTDKYRHEHQYVDGNEYSNDYANGTSTDPSGGCGHMLTEWRGHLHGYEYGLSNASKWGCLADPIQRNWHR
jgi:hypothetical protein